jgi:signal peptidase I
MFGIFVAGQNITLLQDYYNCHPVSIGDIIVFNYKGNLGDKDWIKQVYAKAGDTIELLKESGKTYILVNGKKIYNYQNKAYQVDSVGASYIHLAQKTQMQNNIIPRGYYLVLGTALIGGWDSRRVGLIPHNTILGKVKDISN